MNIRADFRMQEGFIPAISGTHYRRVGCWRNKIWKGWKQPGGSGGRGARRAL